VEAQEIARLVGNRLLDVYRGYPMGVCFERVVVMPSTLGPPRTPVSPGAIRCEFRHAGTSDHFFLQVSLSEDIHFSLEPQVIESLVSEIRSEVNRFLRSGDMAQWNQRPDQRLRQQENQRRQARGQPTTEPTPDGLHPSLTAVRTANEAFLTDYFNQDGPVRRLFREDARETYRIADTTFIRNTAPGGTWASTAATTNGDTWINTGAARNPYYYTGNSTNGTNAIFGEPVSEAPLTVTESQLKTMLRDLIKENLDLRLSVQESDGEITVEAEVYFDGELITSDSDMIQL
jgi:DNA primase